MMDLDVWGSSDEIDALFRHLANCQHADEEGDAFVKVCYRRQGQYVAEFGLLYYDGHDSHREVVHCIGYGDGYHAALLDLWAVIKKARGL